MSQQYDNTNRGTLGRNKLKEKDTHPDYSGKINIEGVEYWLSGWLKQGDGEKFFSLSVKRKEPKPENVEAEFRKEVDRNFGAVIEDDLPF